MPINCVTVTELYANIMMTTIKEMRVPEIKINIHWELKVYVSGAQYLFFSAPFFISSSHIMSEIPKNKI